MDSTLQLSMMHNNNIIRIHIIRGSFKKLPNLISSIFIIQLKGYWSLPPFKILSSAIHTPFLAVFPHH